MKLTNTVTKSQAMERSFVYPDALSCENGDCLVKNDENMEMNFNIYMQASGGAFLYSKTPKSIINKYVVDTMFSLETEFEAPEELDGA